MKKLTKILVATGLIVIAGGAWMFHRADATETPAYRFATVEHGNLSATVSATGTLGAVRTVQVGTQVSGQIAAIYVDFNEKVKKGELLARIDPTLQQQAVQDAQAGLERAQAQLELAQEEYDRNKKLFDAKIITAAEYGTTNANLSVAKSNIKSASIALSRAKQNLAYTNIYSPIDGVIVERNVDVGQTVAASLSAPQLFLIANDLSQMQILANVDEGDIGSIEQGQDVHFTVQSYPNRQFTGRVSQVRLQSKTTDNVVNYTAVVTVENPTGALLPGMTATLSFVTGEATDVMMVPSAALRYRPTEKELADAGITMPARGARRDSTGRASRDTTSAGAARPRGGFGMLWYLNAKGKLAIARVRTGLTDGSRTVVQSDSLKPQMQVILGSATAAQTTTANNASSTNPLQPQRGGFGGPAGPGGAGGARRF